LEFELLNISVYCLLGGRDALKVKVMTSVFDSSVEQYAVIEIHGTEGPSEFFVFAYSDEQSLRDLIAGPSIAAYGNASREQAQAKIDANFSTAAAEKQTFRKVSVAAAEKYPPGVLSAKRCLGARFDLSQTGRIVRGCIEAAVGMAVLIFYSRNAVSTVIRSIVGG
jgi:hypothetical protein